MTRPFARTIASLARSCLALCGLGAASLAQTPPAPDIVPPTVASFTVGTSTATSVNFLLTFSESVTGVNSADFTAVATGGAVATVGTVTGSAASYTIPVTFTGSGTVQLNLNASGTGIADLATNAIAVGATGPVFTIPPVSTGTRVISATVPANGTYGKNDVLLFTMQFSGNVTLTENGGTEAAGKNKSKPNDDDEDEDDASAYFTWRAVTPAGQNGESGKAQYVSGSGTNTLTFRLKVHNGDVAPSGILLGTAIELDDVVLRDASNAVLGAPNLTIPWAANPLAGVIFNAPKPGNGKGRNDRLVNLSSRLRVTGGDASRSVVAGFVVTGEGSKQVLIRAIGPGLAGFGVKDGLAEPVLTLRDSTGKVVAENSGWANRSDIAEAADRVGAFKLGHGSKDAALLATIAPGAYTAQVTAKGNGLVLLEVYDAVSGTQLATEQIVNISTRGFVGTNDDVLVAGFVVTGNAAKRVLIRGIGPGLATFGVTDTLVDPMLKLYRAGTTSPVAQNDNWETPQPINAAQTPATAAEISAASTSVGAFPLANGSKDAAIVISLAPGNYSAVVSGANNGTGGGLVEIYELP